MDDTPDKLRRNVVVLAAAILAIAFFHLSFRPTGTLLGFAEVGNVSAFKVWLALTLVLLYVFLRYRFHDDTDQDLRTLVEHYAGLRYAAIQRCVTDDVQSYLLMRRRQPQWTEGFEALQDDMFASAYAEFGPPTSVDLRPSVQHPDHSPWSGDVDFSSIGVRWPDGQQRSVSGSQRYPYQLPRHVAAVITMGSLLRTATYSKSAVDVLVPFALAILAMLVCLYKLAFFFPV